MGLRFDYPDAFIAVWKAHPVGVKKPAFEAWKKLRLTADENQELIDHLTERHRLDVRWREGVYVPHLSTFLNQRRWEDNYQRVTTRRADPSEARPAEFWLRMGYASEADYKNGRRINH